jgi:MFS transporter, putative metabolite:H+ symporter
MTKTTATKILNINVVIAALGYFVDIYDLLLFGIVRVVSLKSIGIPEDQLLDKGVFLINAQMAGMLVGGLLWGVLGDRKGRVTVLFGSIAMYSLANIANAFIEYAGPYAFESYAILRFVAGVGLAGELGCAITLVSETMSKETRGYGTTIVAAVGILGAVVAALIGDAFSWQTAYIIGGVMGLALLVFRVSMFESGMFAQAKESNVPKGDIRMLFHPFPRFLKYLRCILIGVPVWFVVGILVTFSPELAKDIGVIDPISAGKSIMWCYIGLSAGDLASGFLSQWIKSRRKAIGLFLGITAALILSYIFAPEIFGTAAGGAGLTAPMFYALCTGLGFGVGYWAVFVTVAAEQFGTNLRATVATSVPNFVRGSVVPLTLTFQYLHPHFGLRGGALWVGAAAMGIAFLALFFMQETYGKDLDYLEK